MSVKWSIVSVGKVQQNLCPKQSPEGGICQKGDYTDGRDRRVGIQISSEEKYISNSHRSVLAMSVCFSGHFKRKVS